MYDSILQTILIIDFHMMLTSAAKPDPFFWVEPDFGPKIRVESGQVGPQGQKTCPIGSGWPQIRVQIWVQPYNVLNKPE